ncbi:MAG: efflux RND transporter permease subunit [Candidatus Hydrogenedentales bacterium]|jgi:multidrug efflux pump subunit AcrB
MSAGTKQPGYRGAIAWMANHSVAASLILWICLAGGFIALLHTKQEVFPDIAPDTVSISMVYPGASPEEVEHGIILAIEEGIRSLEGVKEVTSTAREGSASVMVELLLGEDVNRLGQEIKSEVDRIVTFPEEAEEPEVRIDARRRDVIEVVIYGDAPDTSLHQVAEQLRDWLLHSPDITQVDLQGLPPLEIGIEISQENLRRYRTTPEQIAQTLRNAALDLPGGGLKTPAGEILLRLKERRDYGRQFAEIPVVTTALGSQVLLKDIAYIDDSFADTDRYSKFNGQRSVHLEVYRVGSETPIGVAKAVRQLLEEYQPFLPPGIKTSTHRDRSETYRQRVELLVKNGVMGLVLVLVLLGVFLEARLAFWVMMGVPVSFMGSFLFLPAGDVTINMMSLFGFIIALGMVIDTNIVVGENVYYYHQEGLPFLEAAIRGTREVASPVVFSVLTNIVGFVPIYFIPGYVGKTFQMIPVVVCVVFVLALIESLYVLPSQLGHQRDRVRKGINRWLHERQQKFSRRVLHWVRDYYGPALEYVLQRRYIAIAIALGALALSLSYALSGRMGFQQFPIIESDFADAQVVLPYGAPVARTEAIMDRIQACAEQIVEESGHPELVVSVTTDIGRTGGHTGRMRVELAEPAIRDAIMSTTEFTRRWREAVGEVPGVEYLRFTSDSGGPGSWGRPLAVELSHRHMDLLEQTSAELADILATYPGVNDVDDGFQPGKEQLDFTLKPEGKSLGLTPRDVARQVRYAFYGAEVLRQQRGRNEIKVMVRLPEEERSSEHTIQSLMIQTPSGAYVPFREIAEINRGRAYTTIGRRNGRRVVEVSADIVPRSRAGEVLKDLQEDVLPEFLRDHPGLSFSFEGHQAEIRESMGSLRVTFLLALMAIYALLAIPFRSYTQPLVVMLSIPFGIVGAFLGHLIMGYDLSIPSMFGIVALAGVVVNDALVMIDFANFREREEGLSPHDAIHSAAVQRFRPIMLTTLTTFGGLAPMIFETSRQARFLIPMALSLGFGILFGTAVTLVIVPSMYLTINDVRHYLTRAGRAVLPSSAKTADTQELSSAK